MIKIVQKRNGAGFENNDTFRNYYQYTEQGVDLALVECGYEHCDPNHYWMGRKGFHIIHVISSGKGTLEIGGCTYKLSAGDGFYVAPDQDVKYTADEEDPWEYRWLGFTGTRAVIAMNLTNIPSSIIFHVDDLQDTIGLMSDIYDHASCMTERGEMMALGYLHFFLARLMTNHGRKDRIVSASSELVNLAISMIRENYMHDYGVQEICDGLNITRSYLYKLFMRYCKISPSDYLLKFRLEKAREILASQNVPIGAIAEKTGFASHAYFTKRFHMAYGITPREYARGLHTQLIDDDARYFDE